LAIPCTTHNLSISPPAPPPLTTLFPYTTLFRSRHQRLPADRFDSDEHRQEGEPSAEREERCGIAPSVHRGARKSVDEKRRARGDGRGAGQIEAPASAPARDEDAWRDECEHESDRDVNE